MFKNLKNFSIKLGIIAAVLLFTTIHAEDAAPTFSATLSYTSKAELITAPLCGLLTGYAEYLKINSGKSDNKALAIDLASNFMSLANNSLALFNAYQKCDLYKIGNDGKNIHQWLTLMLILQDICSLGKTSKDLISHLTSQDDAEEWEKLEEAQKTLSKSDEEKLTKFAKRLLVYVLPAIKTAAASAMAYDSMKYVERTKDQELINYISFVAIAGCASLSEYLESKQGSAAYYLAIAKAVICATAILVDIKLHDIRKDADSAKALTAEQERARQAQEQLAAELNELKEKTRRELAAAEELVKQKEQAVEAANISALQTFSRIQEIEREAGYKVEDAEERLERALEETIKAQAEATEAHERAIKAEAEANKAHEAKKEVETENKELKADIEGNSLIRGIKELEALKQKYEVAQDEARARLAELNKIISEEQYRQRQIKRKYGW